MNLAAGEAIRHPAVPPAAMSELKWVKETYLRRQQGSLWFYDDLFLCSTATLPWRVFSYDEPRRSVVPIQGLDRLRDRYCKSIRTDVPLTASFRHEEESLFWTFGPYDRGTYGIVIGNGVQAFELPRSDGFRLPGVTALTLRVRYESPDHWVTYSPDLTLDFSRSANFEWRR